MVKNPGLYLCAFFLSILVLLGCQPEMADQAEPSATTQLPQQPTVVSKPTEVRPSEIPAAKPTATVTAETIEIPSGNTPESQGGTADREEELVELAREDLSRWLGVPAKEINTVSVEAVQWPNASLGCPLPGVIYAEVLTPGFKIILVGQGEEYEYHSDYSQDRIIYCDADGRVRLPAFPIVPGEIDDGIPWVPVD
jgi:hypothetical protein